MATIFPGNRMKKTRIVRETGEGSVTFDGLSGGTEEYVITGRRKNFCTLGCLLSRSVFISLSFETIHYLCLTSFVNIVAS